jgi:hypothetical protein
VLKRKYWAEILIVAIAIVIVILLLPSLLSYIAEDGDNCESINNCPEANSPKEKSKVLPKYEYWTNSNGQLIEAGIGGVSCSVDTSTKGKMPLNCDWSKKINFHENKGSQLIFNHLLFERILVNGEDCFVVIDNENEMIEIDCESLELRIN